MRTLHKQVKYHKNREHIREDLGQDEEVSGDSEDTIVNIEHKVRCEECGKGFYKEYEIMDKCFGTCNVCENRKRLR